MGLHQGVQIAVAVIRQCHTSKRTVPNNEIRYSTSPFPQPSPLPSVFIEATNRRFLMELLSQLWFQNAAHWAVVRLMLVCILLFSHFMCAFFKRFCCVLSFVGYLPFCPDSIGTAAFYFLISSIPPFSPQNSCVAPLVGRSFI